jgi:hypothetical protein
MAFIGKSIEGKTKIIESPLPRISLFIKKNINEKFSLHCTLVSMKFFQGGFPRYFNLINLALENVLQ